jgi:hypothetical protein
MATLRPRRQALLSPGVITQTPLGERVGGSGAFASPSADGRAG